MPATDVVVVQVNDVAVTAPDNVAPIATSQSIEINQDTFAALVLAGEDSDGSIVRFTVTTTPSSGRLTGTAPRLTYTPNTGFSGSDQFAFTVTDDAGATSTPATVSVAVQSTVVANIAPAADAQSVETAEDVQLAITLTGSDPDGTLSAFSITVPPASGTLSGVPPQIQYRPNPDFNGTDQFEFSVTDNSGVQSQSATVLVEVSPVNDPPMANAGPSIAVDVGSIATLDGSASRDVEDGMALQFHWFEISELRVQLDDANSAMPSFTAPPVDAPRAAWFVLTVTDSQGAFSTQIVSVGIHPLPTLGTVSGTTSQFSDVLLTMPDGRATLTIPAGAVANDTTVTMTQRTQAQSAAQVPGVDSAVSAFYEFSPENLEFTVPAFLEFDPSAQSNTDTIVDIVTPVAPNSGPHVSEVGTFTEYNNSHTRVELNSLPGLISFRRPEIQLDFPRNIAMLVGESREIPITATASTRYLLQAETDLAFGAATGSNTEVIISTSIDQPFARELFSNGTREETASVDVTCNSFGRDQIITRHSIDPFEPVGNVGFASARRFYKLVTNVACRAEIPTALAAFIFSVGTLPEGVALAPPPPYKPENGVDNTTQRFIVASPDELNIFTARGEKIHTLPQNGDTIFGALQLRQPNDDEWTFTFGDRGKRVFPIGEGFGFGDAPPGQNRPTFSAKYGRNLNGDRDYDTAISVANGVVERTRPEGTAFVNPADTIFDGSANNLPDTSRPLFGCDVLSHRKFICVTVDGHIYGIDSMIPNGNLTLIADNAGSEVRDIECEIMDALGTANCIASAFVSTSVMHCRGSIFDLSSFQCGIPISVASAVSVGVAKTAAGNLAVAVPNAGTSSLHMLEFEADGTLNFNAEIPLTEIMQLPGLENLFLLGAAHAELDPTSDTVVVTGSGSDNVLILPLDLLATLPSAPTSIENWFVTFD